MAGTRDLPLMGALFEGVAKAWPVFAGFVALLTAVLAFGLRLESRVEAQKDLPARVGMIERRQAVFEEALKRTMVPDLEATVDVLRERTTRIETKQEMILEQVRQINKKLDKGIKR